MHTSFLAKDFTYRTLEQLASKGMYITGGKFKGSQVYYIINKDKWYGKSDILNLVS